MVSTTCTYLMAIISSVDPGGGSDCNGNVPFQRRRLYVDITPRLSSPVVLTEPCRPIDGLLGSDADDAGVPLLRFDTAIRLDLASMRQCDAFGLKLSKSSSPYVAETYGLHATYYTGGGGFRLRIVRGSTEVNNLQRYYNPPRRPLLDQITRHTGRFSSLRVDLFRWPATNKPRSHSMMASSDRRTFPPPFSEPHFSFSLFSLFPFPPPPSPCLPSVTSTTAPPAPLQPPGGN